MRACVCVWNQALLLRSHVVAMAMNHANVNVDSGAYREQNPPLLHNASKLCLLACIDSANCVHLLV